MTGFRRSGSNPVLTARIPCVGDRLRAAAEDLADLQAYDRAAAGLKSGQDELIPADCANRLLSGENALCVYRDLPNLLWPSKPV